MDFFQRRYVFLLCDLCKTKDTFNTRRKCTVSPVAFFFAHFSGIFIFSLKKTQSPCGNKEPGSDICVLRLWQTDNTKMYTN